MNSGVWVGLLIDLPVDRVLAPKWAEILVVNRHQGTNCNKILHVIYFKRMFRDIATKVRNFITDYGKKNIFQLMNAKLSPWSRKAEISICKKICL